MSVRMSNLVWQLGLKGNQLVIMLAVADEADSEGTCFTGQRKLALKARVSERTVRSTLSAMRERGILHTERRPAEWGSGRQVDAIILDQVQMARQAVEEVEDVEEVQLREANRARYEIDPEAANPQRLEAPFETPEPVDNRPEIQPATFAGRDVVPSQTEPATFAGRSFNRQNRVVQPATFDRKSVGALKGTHARIVPSCPVQSSEEGQVVDNGPDRTGQDENSSPGVISSEEASQIPAQPVPSSVHGVPLRLLRAKLGGETGVLGGVDDETLIEVIEVVMARVNGPVSSPTGLMIRALREIDGPDAIEEAQARVLARVAAEKTREPGPADAALVTCPVHGVQHRASAMCPGCRADELTVVEEECTPGPEGSGGFDLGQWRAARAAQREESQGARLADKANRGDPVRRVAGGGQE